MIRLAVLWWLATAALAACALVAVARLRRIPPAPVPGGVTLILPIRGLDAGAEAHYRHWLEQDPGVPYQVIFSLQDPADPALPLLRRLAAAWPSRAEITVNPVQAGLNAKASNLHHGVLRARHPLLVMADSDVDPPPDLLRRMLPPLADPAVGVVACVPVATAAAGTWGRMLAMALNFTLAGSWVPLARLGLPMGVSGACVAMRQDVLEQIGGVPAFGAYVAEDAQLGRLALRAGYRIALGPPVRLEVGPSSYGAVFGLFSRGAYMARFMFEPPLRAGMNLAMSGDLLLLIAAALTGSPAAVAAAAGAAAARWALGAALQGALEPRAWWYVVYVPAILALSVAAGLRAHVTDRVRWRGVTYRVGPGGRVAVVDAATPGPPPAPRRRPQPPA